MLSSSRTRGPRCAALKYHSLKNPLNAVQPLWLHSIFFGIFNSHRSWKALPWLGELRSIQRRYRGQALARRWRVAEKLPGMPGPGRHPIPRHAAPAARPPPMCRGPRESEPCTGGAWGHARGKLWRQRGEDGQGCARAQTLPAGCAVEKPFSTCLPSCVRAWRLLPFDAISGTVRLTMR